MNDATTSTARRGLLYGLAAYTCWGLLPLYLHLLTGVPALQVLAHRVVWSLLLLLALVLALKRWAGIRAAARGRTLALLTLSACLIAVNWLVYIWAVLNAHLLEASLGYFLNPLVNVALGVAVLGERLRRGQALAVAIAAAGVLALAVSSGGLPWVSLALAGSWSLYGLVRKVAAIDALGGLFVETALLAPASLLVLATAAQAGTGAFGREPRLDLLLVLAGAVTATPLLLFTAAAKRLRLGTLGLLQYLSPSLQFAEAVLLYREPLAPARLLTFALIWAGCALYAWDSVRAARVSAASAARPPSAARASGA